MKHYITYLLLLIVFLLQTGLLKSQQEIQNGLYMFNPNILNPACAGSRHNLSATLAYRQQWVRWDGAPQTAMLSMNGPLPIINKKTRRYSTIALGLNIVQDKIGATQNTSINADYSYRIVLNKQKFSKGNKNVLSFGIRAGADNYRSVFFTLRSIDAEDQVQSLNNYNKWMFNVGAGIYYFGRSHYIGIAVPKLLQNTRSSINGIYSRQELHIYFMAGYVFRISSDVDFKPSIQLKYTHNAPISVEGNASFLLMEKVWIGAMYRHKAAIGLNIMVNMGAKLRVGYAYEYTTTNMIKVSASTHELMLSYDLKGSKDVNYTPARLYF